MRWHKVYLHDQFSYGRAHLEYLLPRYFACIDDDEPYPPPQVEYMDVGWAFDQLAPWHQAALYWGYGSPELPADGVVVGQDVQGALRLLQRRLGGSRRFRATTP